MTDRELLELAAKAAGIAIEKTRRGIVLCQSINAEKRMGSIWNPLADDGDALRLAVKLTLEIDVCMTGIAVRTPIGHKVLIDSKQEPDAYAATRRAITRAAAEIGKAMP
jgi:hypothetical protein